MVSVEFGSMVKVFESAPERTNFHVHPSRVALQAGKAIVPFADNVPTYTRLSVSASVTPAVTVLNAPSSTPLTFIAANDAVATPVIPPLPVISPVFVCVPPHVLFPAKVWVVVDTMPPRAAVAFGTLKFTVVEVRATEKAASLNVKAAVAA